MTAFVATRGADLRLAILEILDRPANSGEANETWLLMELAGVGHAPGQQELRDELAWLAGKRCLSLSPGRQIHATITGRGADVAHGRVRVPGILVPEPT